MMHYCNIIIELERYSMQYVYLNIEKYKYNYNKLYHYLKLQEAEKSTNATICIKCCALLHSEAVDSFI